ncbi:hypothetical protein H1R20_g11344, partial [Candolleomyces eurysporus]
MTTFAPGVVLHLYVVPSHLTLLLHRIVRIVVLVHSSKTIHKFVIREAECSSRAGPKFKGSAKFANAAAETATTSTEKSPGTTVTRVFYVASEDDLPKLRFLICRHVAPKSTVEQNVEYE